MKRSTTCSTPYEITSEGNDVVVDIVYVKKKIPTSAMCYPYSTQSMKTESKLFVRKSQSLTLPPIPYANLHLCSDLVFFSCLVCLYFFLLLYTPNEYRRKGANRFRGQMHLPYTGASLSVLHSTHDFFCCYCYNETKTTRNESRALE